MQQAARMPRRVPGQPALAKAVAVLAARHGARLAGDLVDRLGLSTKPARPTAPSATPPRPAPRHVRHQSRVKPRHRRRQPGPSSLVIHTGYQRARWYQAPNSIYY